MPAALFFNEIRYAQKANNVSYVFRCGFQSFVEAIAGKILTVHLGAEIVGIKRLENGTVEIVREDGAMEKFDQVVIASGLNAVSSIMDVSDEERDLFSRIKTLNYLTSYVGGNFEDDDDPMATSSPSLYIFEPNAVEERIDHVSMIMTSSAGATAVWPVIREAYLYNLRLYFFLDTVK